VSLHEVEWAGPGRLATMARPPGGDDLPAAMAALAASGVEVLVSALRADEAELLELTGEPAAAAAAGLEFVNLPILDGGVPEPAAMPAVRRLVDRLADELRAGRFVVTHCRAGIGRCSMLAGATLVRLGVTPAQAWRMVREARGLPVPDNPDQEAWLYRIPPGDPADPGPGGR
jgi:protein-tyrosine phosphatase